MRNAAQGPLAISAGRCFIYCRISQDGSREGLGVARQEQDCRAKAAAEGLEVVDVFVDNDLGASNLSRRQRPAYEEMLERVRSGDAGVVVTYSNSRLTRRPSEWIELINLANVGSMQIVTCVSGDYDLTTADGRAVALTIAAWDAAEAERTGERVRRAIRERVSNGMPKHNRYRTFGYNRDWSVNEEEASRVRDAFKRFVEGESVQSIVESWKTSGVVVGGGKTLYHSTVRNVLTRPLYAGLMVHRGAVVGRTCVPVIVDESVWNAAQALFGETAPPRSGRNARKYLLAGLVTCGRCGFPMAGKAVTKSKTGRHNYECSRASGGCGGMGVSGQRVEALVLSVVRQGLIVGQSEAEPESFDYASKIAEVDADLQVLQAGIADGTMRAIDVSDAIKAISGRRRELERGAAEAEITAPPSRFERWDEFGSASLSARVAAIRRHVKGVVVNEAASKAWNPHRILIYTSRGNEVPGWSITPVLAAA